MKQNLSNFKEFFNNRLKMTGYYENDDKIV